MDAAVRQDVERIVLQSQEPERNIDPHETFVVRNPMPSHSETRASVACRPAADRRSGSR